MILRCFIFLFLFFALSESVFSQDSHAQSSPTPRPDYFKGTGGIVTIPGSLQIAESGTILESKDTLLEYKIKHLRTGLLKNDLSYKAGGQFVFSSKGLIPAGTLMHAQSYGSVYDSQTGRTASGLGWCAVRVDEDKPVCIFWDGTSRWVLSKKAGDPITKASYLEGDNYQSKYHTPTFRTSLIEGGTIPEIEEKGVDFDRDFIVRVKFHKFKKGSARLIATFDDGDQETSFFGFGIKLQKLILDENDEVEFSLLGKNMKLTRIEKKQAKFEILD